MSDIDKSELLAACTVFMRSSYDLMGAYLDAIAGLDAIEREIVGHQERKIQELSVSDPGNATMEFMDQAPVTHQFADGQNRGKLLHRRTMGEFKKGVAQNGSVRRRLGDMLVTLLYATWEEEHRQTIASVLGFLEKRDFTSDLLGDLGNLRHAIVHANGIATEKVENARMLKWFRRGDLIFITVNHVDELFGYVDLFVSKLLLDHDIGENELRRFVSKPGM